MPTPSAKTSAATENRLKNLIYPRSFPSSWFFFIPLPISSTQDEVLRQDVSFVGGRMVEAMFERIGKINRT